MSKGRVFSRPRTKVYDTNYSIGESLYRPALDRLDGKYGRFGPPAGADLLGVRSPPPPPPPQPSAEFPSARAALREMEDEFFGEAPRRRPASALLGEFDAVFEGRMRNGAGQERAASRAARLLDEDVEDELSSSAQRLRAVKASRAFAEEMDELESGFSGRKDPRSRPRMDFSDKLMDSVGLTGRARAALEEEGSTVGRRRFLKMTSASSEAGDGEEMTKWTALKPPGTLARRHLTDEDEETAIQSGAAARARKSRARLEDLESEMQALSERSAAREKRVRDLKALVQENEASALDNLQTTVRVKSSIQSEKKTVTF